MANEEVFPGSRSDGHHLIHVAFKHLLYGLQFFMVAYANFYAGISIDLNGTSAMMVFVIGKLKSLFPAP